MLASHKRGQIALDYLVIVGLAMALIVLLIGILVTYSGSLSTAFGQDTLSTAATAIVEQVNYVYSLSPGSISTTAIDFPAMDFPMSHFCGKEAILSYQNSFSVEQAYVNISGLLPTTPGLNDVLVRNVDLNGTDTVQIGLYRSISFVGFNYTLSGNILNYAVEFYNSSGGIIKSPQTFELSVYSPSYSLINTTVETAPSGTYSGSILLANPQAASVLLISPIGKGVVFSTCI
ncbi:MAG: hypothetical protein ACP5TF_02980 [Candidatus Acidifodinimicrobium sp.]